MCYSCLRLQFRGQTQLTQFFKISFQIYRFVRVKEKKEKSKKSSEDNPLHGMPFQEIIKRGLKVKPPAKTKRKKK